MKDNIQMIFKFLQEKFPKKDIKMLKANIVFDENQENIATSKKQKENEIKEKIDIIDISKKKEKEEKDIQKNKDNPE